MLFSSAQFSFFLLLFSHTVKEYDRKLRFWCRTIASGRPHVINSTPHILLQLCVSTLQLFILLIRRLFRSHAHTHTRGTPFIGTTILFTRCSTRAIIFKRFRFVRAFSANNNVYLRETNMIPKILISLRPWFEWRSKRESKWERSGNERKQLSIYYGVGLPSGEFLCTFKDQIHATENHG